MFKFLKRNAKTIALVASLTLNVLGGAGVIPPPLVGALNTVLGGVQ